MTRPSVQFARNIAARLRRQGYTEAEVAEEYCIDGNTIEQDNFVTFTACVYAGPHKSKGKDHDQN